MRLGEKAMALRKVRRLLSEFGGSVPKQNSLSGRDVIGLPEKAKSAFLKVSIRDLPATQRFESWRKLFPYIDIDVIEREKVASLQGQVVRFVSDEGHRFLYVQNDDTAAAFGRGESGFVYVALTLAGRCMVECADGTAFMAHPATGMVIVDGAKPVKITREGHSVIGLALPRGEVLAALGVERDLPEAGVFVLPLTGLTRLLASHMCEIAKESEVFDQEAANIAVKAASDLALGAVSQGLLGAQTWTGVVAFFLLFISSRGFAG